MSVALLDVNVLIALGDPYHEHHERVHAWFHAEKARAWATCPLTENGFLRILGNPSYKDSPGTPAEIRPVLQTICLAPGHQFWPDEISLRDAGRHAMLPSSRHLTDYYLLSLAVHRRGRLASLDERIDPTFIPGGSRAYLIIP